MKKGETTKKKSAKATGVTLKTIAINALIILALIAVIAVASHFLLRTGTRHGSRRVVPEFKGISLSEAQQLAKENDLKLFINDSLYAAEFPGGTVMDQLPHGGVYVKPDRTIYIVINAFNKRMVEVPFVAGRSLRQAKNTLDVAGLEIKHINYVPDMATNYVLSQSYNNQAVSSRSKIKAPVGSGVDLTVGVSSDDPYTRIPNVVGLSVREAKSRIWESGLNVGRINIDKGVNLLRDKNAKVYKQDTEAHSLQKWGAQLNITVTMDQAKIEKESKKAHQADLQYEATMQ